MCESNVGKRVKALTTRIRTFAKYEVYLCRGLNRVFKSAIALNIGTAVIHHNLLIRLDFNCLWSLL